MGNEDLKFGREAAQNLNKLSADEKRKYLFQKQVATLNSFRERNAISREQYDISYSGLVSKMGLTEQEVKSWLEHP